MNNEKLDYFMVSATMILSTLVLFVYNIYVRKYVMPYEYGIYTSANMLLLYLNYAQMGVLNSYNRDYPQLLGAKNYQAASHVKNIVFTYLIMLYGITFLVLMILFAFLITSQILELKLGIGLLVNSFFAFLTAIYNFMDNSLKSEKKFKYSSLIRIIKTTILVLTGYFVISTYKYYGLFISTGVSLIFIILLNIKFFFSLKISINKSIITDMIRSGLPLLVNGLIWTIMMSVDKFVILFFMSMEDLGVYSVALLGFSTLVIIPQSITQIFYIKMSQKYGETNNIDVLVNYAKRYTLYLAIITSFIIIGAYYILPIFIENMMPNYADSIKSAQILVIGVGLYSTTLLYSNVFSVIRRNAVLIKSTIILCVFNIVMSSSLVILLGKNIEHVAYGTSISYALYALVLVFMLSKTLKQSYWNLIQNSLLPVIISIILLIIISLTIKNSFYGLLLNITLAFIFLRCLYKDNIWNKNQN